MSSRRRFRCWSLLLGAACIVPLTTARAQDDGDVALAMDRKLPQLSLSSMEIPDALAEIGRQASVKIAMTDAAAELLPWGRHTKIADLSVRQASLREILPQVLDPLGMTYVVGEDGIVVSASEPLARVNRRATWEELKLLRECNQTPYASQALAGLDIQYRLTSKVDAPKMLERQLDRAGQGSLAQILEVACGSLGWVWLPEDKSIVIRTREAQIANQLSRRLSVKYTNTALSKILNDLASRADVAIFFEPGMMLKLPRSTAQNCTLLMEQGTIRQAFELLAAETGIEYQVSRDGISVGLSEAIAGDGAHSAARRSPYVGKITIPGKDGSFAIDFLLSSEDLPPDILEYREQIIEDYVERARPELQALVEKHMEQKAATDKP